MTHSIHPSAIVSDKAKLGNNVKIGAFCIVDEHVTLGDNVELMPHAYVTGRTTIGKDTKIYPFASIGSAPQDLKYAGEESEVIIGERNTIREYVTIQPGTKDDAMKTVVGDNCLLMVGCHVAHDCILGNYVQLANFATLAGHVKVEDYTIIGGLAAVKQFTRIGAHAMIGGMCGITRDVIPYGLVITDNSKLRGLNVVGLKRRGFSNSDIQHLQQLYQDIFYDHSKPLNDRVKELKEKTKDHPASQKMIDFILDESSGHLCFPDE